MDNDLDIMKQAHGQNLLNQKMEDENKYTD